MLGAGVVAELVVGVDAAVLRLEAVGIEGRMLEAVGIEGAVLAVMGIEGTTLEVVEIEGAVLAAVRIEGTLLGVVGIEGSVIEAVGIEGAVLEAVGIEGMVLVVGIEGVGGGTRVLLSVFSIGSVASPECFLPRVFRVFLLGGIVSGRDWG